MLRTQMPDRFVSARTVETASPRSANDHSPVRGQTEPFMFTRLFFVTGLLLGGLALAAMLSS
ncbi:hypothetical protein [Aminobacter sp. AP02]|uniref:hypothetical protein n=1 Tax=Aminobacter sp. AP02 TaxID=2135737 RepID=UPI000D7B463F|nr:hypothetical protein [Aminobacter sp. AP02]PWK76378.1 hypothetical protein C8K44_102368 [Aminobacter sp. AP02]